MAKQTAASTSKSATEGSATEGKAGVFGKIKSAWSTTTDFVASTKQKVKNELASRRGESHPDPRLPKQKVHENYDVTDEDDLQSLNGGLQ